MKSVKSLVDMQYFLFIYFQKIKKYCKFVKIYPTSSITHFDSILVKYSSPWIYDIRFRKHKVVKAKI